jgi:hypothetical protein
MSGATTSGPEQLGFAPSTMEEEITAIFNQLLYPPQFMEELDGPKGILKKTLNPTSYPTPASIESDIYRLKAFTEFEPPVDANRKKIEVGKVYMCRAPLSQTAVPVKITTTDGQRGTVNGIDPKATNATTATPLGGANGFPAARCTLAVARPKSKQRGGQTVTPFPGKTYAPKIKSLATILDTMGKIQATYGPAAFDAIISDNQKKLADQAKLITDIQNPSSAAHAQLIAYEKARLEQAKTEIQAAYDKYVADKARAQTPSDEFAKAITNMQALKTRAEQRLAALIAYYDRRSSSGIGMHGGRMSRKSRKGGRKASRKSGSRKH